MTKERPNFDPQHPHTFPVEGEGDNKMLIHCLNHQQARPKEGQSDTPEMKAVRAEILQMCKENKVKVGNVSSTYCIGCFHDVMEELDKLEVNGTFDTDVIIPKE